ncbi:MAG TPA: polysaccharide biosynthesis tyrosine autokinase [Solirubrobacteraceae bacterium]
MLDSRPPEGSPSRRRALRALRRRLPVFLLVAVAVPATSVAYSLTQEKQYTSSAALLFRDSGLDQAILGIQTYRTSGDSARDAATNLNLANLDVVADRTARRLGGTLRRNDVKSRMDISQEGLSNIVRVEATDADPRFAARLATTFAEEFIGFREESDSKRLADAQRITKQQYEALPAVTKNSPQGRQLRDRSQQLEILASLQTGGAELVQRADVPSSPSYPRPLRNAIIGLLLGLGLGLMLAYLIDRLDRRIQDPEEMQEEFAKPILATIPHSAKLDKGKGILAQDAATAEAFRMLRANLRYFNVDRGLHTVLITSAAPGDGKSTVAANLAAAAAANGMKTLLVEVDLRHPTIAKGLGVPATPGLTHVLARDAQLDLVVRAVAVQAGDHDAASGRTMDVVVSGPLPPNPTDLIESERMRDVLRQAAQEYEFVVIDTPPTAVVPDAIPLVTQVDGVVVVGRVGKSTREALAHLRKQLDNLDAPTLGVVVNDVSSKAAGYAYGYGYGYHADPDAVDASMTMNGTAGRPAEDELLKR